MPLGLTLSLPASVPISLLPVRLETRFVGTELLIRIYPDDIHRDTHETALTADEQQWAQNFWRETWRAGLAPETAPEYAQRSAQERTAWKQLASHFGANRGAYLAQALTPTNPGDRPSAYNLDQPLAAEPSFPAVGATRAGSWTRAAQARCLPDTWLAIGYAGGQAPIVARGSAIPPDLAIGPNPSAVPPAGGGAPTARPPMDPDILWMVDFDEAVAKGMGLRMTLPAQQAAGGLDRLVVIGVRQGAATAGAAGLQQLLDAHRHTWGCAVLPKGTPTNNTEDARSGYSRVDATFQASFELRAQPAPAADDDGSRIAAAFGLPAAAFANTAAARGREQAGVPDMQRVLWPATLQYAVEQFFNGLLPGYDPVRWCDYVAGHVRAAGPLPGLRLGRQPYALLPVTTLDGWGANAPALLPLLKAMRALWLAASAQAPHAGRDTATLGRDLVEALGQQPRSAEWRWRRARGAVFTGNFFQLLDPPVSAGDLAIAIQKGAALVKTALQGLGFNPATPPRISTVSFADVAEPHTAPLAQGGTVAAGDLLAPNYLAGLFDPSISLQDLHDETAALWPDPQQPKPLLYRLARQATLLAYARRALDDSLAEPVPPFGSNPTLAPWFEPELVDGIPDLPPPNSDNKAVIRTPTFWRVLTSTIVDPRNTTQAISRGDFLRQTVRPSDGSALGAFLASLKALAALPAADLERLTADGIDVASHRLDAWISSLASWKLAQCRAQANNADTLAVGGYGWVEDLRPRTAAAASDGFLHAPSIGQANAAAILRSGYLAHQDEATGAQLQIDLSSARVRSALGLIDGVRQGQPLGALLGYRLERRLHALGLDTAIQPLRELAPLAVNPSQPRAAGEPLDAIAANNVVDGAALMQQLDADPDLLAGLGAERAVVEGEIDALAAAVDGINDIALSEAVYQAAQGNYARAAAALDAASRGDLPGEFEMLRTPTGGTGYAQRLALLHDGAAAAGGPWNTARPRALAEPTLETWAASVLGKPDRVKFSATYTVDGAAPRVQVFSLADLTPLPCALDIVYATRVSDEPGQSELELRLLRLAQSQRTSAEAAATLKLGFGHEVFGGAQADLTLPEFLELAAAVRAVIVNSRALNARDLAAAGDAGDPGSSLTGLRSRYVNTLTAWTAARSALQAAMRSTVNTTSLGIAMEAMNGFAIQHAVPFAADDASLKAQAASVLSQVDATNARLPTGLPADLDAPALLDAFKAWFGEAFRLATPFTLGADSTYAEGLAQRDAAGDAGRLQTAEWLSAASRVRPGAERLHGLQLLADAVTPGAAAPLRVAQLPLSNAPWNRQDEATLAGAASIVVAMPGQGANDTVQLPATLAGLMIDEWVEVLPRGTLRTGLALQHEAPAAAAPQAVLLAVAPDPAQPWSEDLLAAIVGETLDLAKVRMVDYDALPPLGQFLPAVYLANNVGGDPAGDTISSRLG